MKLKAFSANFQATSERFGELLEEEVGRWLESNTNIKILGRDFRMTSYSASGEAYIKLVILLWYENRT